MLVHLPFQLRRRVENGGGPAFLCQKCSAVFVDRVVPQPLDVWLLEYPRPDARRVDIAAVLAALDSCHQVGQHENPAIMANRLLWGRLVDVDGVIRGFGVWVKDVPLPVHPHPDENGSMLRVFPIAQGRIRGNNPPRGAVAHVDGHQRPVGLDVYRKVQVSALHEVWNVCTRRPGLHVMLFHLLGALPQHALLPLPDSAKIERTFLVGLGGSHHRGW